MLDRITPPAAMPLHKIPLPAVRTIQLSNGFPVHFVQFGTQQLIELRLVFRAGTCFEPRPYLSNFTAQMLMEGTAGFTGLELARAFDRLGSFVETETGYESSTVSLTTLPSRLAEVLPLVAAATFDPAFPAGDFEKLRARTLQWLDVEEQKTDFMARRTFAGKLYGENHPYGKPLTREAIANPSLEDMRNFHSAVYTPGSGFAVAVGRFDEAEVTAILDRIIGARPFGHVTPEEASQAAQQPASYGSGFHLLPKADAMQSSIRMGHAVFHRRHPDYLKVLMATTVLGGYFGSRLMQNLREEKGFTYHIGASWHSLKYGGMFTISTETGIEYVKPALDEIRSELRKLIDHGVEEEELNLVRNYKLGRLVSSRETPDHIAELISTYLVNGVSLEEAETVFDVIQSTTPEDVQRMAKQYFHPENLLEVVAGRME